MTGFYDKLKDLRKTKGFTIREVADRSGVSTSYISQLENGQRGIPSPEVLQKLAEGLETSYTGLMETAGYLGQHEVSADGEPIELRRLLRECELTFDGRRLSEADKMWIERMLAALFWKERQEDGE